MTIALCGCMMQEPEVVEKLKKSYRFVNLIFGMNKNNYHVNFCNWNEYINGNLYLIFLFCQAKKQQLQKIFAGGK